MAIATIGRLRFHSFFEESVMTANRKNKSSVPKTKDPDASRRKTEKSVTKTKKAKTELEKPKMNAELKIGKPAVKENKVRPAKTEVERGNNRRKRVSRPRSSNGKNSKKEFLFGPAEGTLAELSKAKTKDG